MKKIVIVLVVFIMLLSCDQTDQDLADKNRIYKKSGEYFIYYEGHVLKIDKDVYITSDKKVSDYFPNGGVDKLKFKLYGKSELLRDLDKYFPNEIGYVTENEDLKQTGEIPFTLIENKKYIDTMAFPKYLEKLETTKPVPIKTTDTKTEQPTVEQVSSLKGKKIWVLNATGINGYAKKIGDLLISKLGITFEAENHSNDQMESVLINHKLSDQELEEVMKNLDMKYIQVVKDSKIKPESDFVLITGDDSGKGFTIEIQTIKEKSVLIDKLLEYNPKNVVVGKDKEQRVKDKEGIEIHFNPKNKYIAQKIGKKIGDVKYIEDIEEEKRIIIVSKE